MARPEGLVKRATISVRIRQDIINASTKIPDFRKLLEQRAEEIYAEWVKKNE